MSRARRLSAVVAVTAVFASGPASAETILSDVIRDTLAGCYGVVVTVCQPRVSSNPVSYGSQTVPVCAGTCLYPSVPVPYNDGDDTCVAWRDHGGTETERCLLRQRPQ